MRFIFTLCFIFSGFFNLLEAQDSAILILEAESGEPLEESNPPIFEEGEEDGTSFIRVVGDYPKSPDITNRPGTASRVIAYTLTFPEAGNYALYVRMKIGPGGANDDSFYYGDSFGSKDFSTSTGWIQVNNVANSGFAEAEAVVTGEGSTGAGVWKWLNLTQLADRDGFAVTEDELTQTFYIGSREDGLDLDLFIFAPVEESYTVSELNNLIGIEMPEPMQAIATGKAKWLGNVYSGPQIQDFNSYWNQVTPENAGKWGSVEPNNNQWNFSELDAAYQLAKSNNMPFRFHVLIWGSQQPSWLIGMDPVQQLAEIRQWMDTISQRYPDIDYLEVVNEPLHAPPAQSQQHIDQNRTDYGGYIEALGGNGATGWDWIIKSFELAREYFPNTPLMINDYNIIGSASNTERYMGIVNLLQARGLIDAIGFQAHAFSTVYYNEEVLRGNLYTLAATGLPLIATEMDIDGDTDQQQLAEYQRIFPMLWEHPAMIGITLWGWRPGIWREKANLIKADGSERLALSWLRTYVESKNPLANISISSDENTVSVGETMQFEANLSPSDPDNLTRVQWNVRPVFNSQGKATIDENGLLTATSSGAVIVRLTATTNRGATTFREKEVEILGGPNGFSSEEIAGIKVFPNPVSDGQVFISGTSNVKFIRVEDRLGKFLNELKVQNQETISLSLDLQPGVYIIRLMDGQSFTAQRLIVK